jgi:hypothetical protein
MDIHPSLPALFVAESNALTNASGGVQLYTRELLQVLEIAGFKLQILEYQTDQRLLVRLRRRLFSYPYTGLVPPYLAKQIADGLQSTGSSFVFLNGVELAPVALALRQLKAAPDVPIVLFSYGLESVDYLHAARASGKAGRATAALTLGRQLFAEGRQREAIDYVFTLAPFEAEIERWLGAKCVGWIPRTVPRDQALEWNPSGNRIGSVARLDHPPNNEGIVLFLREFQQIAPPQARFRLVGRPERSGEELSRNFSAVDYLGSLDDAALRREASTWNCFIHPMFCYARGSSTKLATALSWHLPVATTTAGVRGYRWRDGRIPLADSANDLARLAVSLLDMKVAQEVRLEVIAAANSCPTPQGVASDLRSALLSRHPVPTSRLR